MREETDDIRELVDKMVDHALKRGFYAGSAMAGVELERCHQNWARYNLPDEEKAKVKTAEFPVEEWVQEYPKENTRYYTPAQIARKKLILNTKGESSYWYILRLINAGELKYKNVGLGKTPYFQISEAEIERFNREGTKLC